MNLLDASKSRMDSGAILKFREKFKRSLRQCVVRGFSVEESFGMIWVETLEDILLTDEEQAGMYEELILWAKVSLLGFFPGHSPELFTDTSRVFSGSH